jgi:hypothetical protein
LLLWEFDVESCFLVRVEAQEVDGGRNNLKLKEGKEEGIYRILVGDESTSTVNTGCFPFHFT